jgi:SET domain-containing protein
VIRSVAFETDGIGMENDVVLGRRAVALRPIAAGEKIVEWSGEVISGSRAVSLSPKEREQLLQIDDDAFLHVGLDSLVAADFINHSCEPNCGFVNARTLVAIRDITQGESVTFDYAMSDTNAFVVFDCKCGTRSCRGRMTGNDWRRPELQSRYRGWFAPHVQRLIDASST